MNRDMFKTGQRLFFTTNAKLYSDIYEVEVLAVYPDRLDLNLCFHDGYLLLLPVGTTIKWLTPGLKRTGLTSDVISRSTADKVWSVTTPREKVTTGHNTKVLAVGSGKGGVGKTTFSINLALALSSCNQRVVLMDADIGMANVEILLGVRSTNNLADVIQGYCTLSQILVEGPGGIQVLPGFSGMDSLTTLDSMQFNRIISGFAELEDNCDILILDTGAGLADSVLKFLESADEIILVSNPEPHALMDAYALTKVLAQRDNGQNRVNLVMNRCDNEGEALKSSDTFVLAGQRFLEIEPIYQGWLPFDQLVTQSLKKKSPIFLSHPRERYSKQILEIAHKITGLEMPSNKPVGLKAFWKRLKKNWIE
ncbi:MAG: MinD/ParA family protein [Firmicutes bacterium]|nr:MinD/ParA family protein [Bacillota bacterium]